jgi:NAD(P)-dependent dehydrogenase (short-subunit alcohol dehydrogenase family)
MTDTKQVVITGTSSGIGFATAAELVDRGYHVYGSVRKIVDGERVQAKLGPSFTPLLFDVTDDDAVYAAAETVEDVLGDDKNLVGLVNNAGIAVAGPLMYLESEKIRHQFAVNVLGVLTVTQAFLPLLGACEDAPEPPGRVVNISSVSGHTAYPFLGPYSASKHALEALSDSLRRELLLFGIDVVTIVAGAVATPMWGKVEQRDIEAYSKTAYGDAVSRMMEITAKIGQQGMPATKVGRTVRKALEDSKPRSRYVLANNWLAGWILPRWMPARWWDRIIDKQLELSSSVEIDNGQ